MVSIILFLLTTSVGGFFFYKSIAKIRRNINMGKPLDRSDNPKLRLKTMTLVALGQSKMVTRPIAGFFHILIYVGFVLINIEVFEILLDGIFGQHRLFQNALGNIYPIAIGFFEILAFLVIVACIVFLFRRNVSKVKRFSGTEMKGFPLFDANAILYTEIVLMLALLIMNATDASLLANMPISGWLKPMFSHMAPNTLHIIMEICWWFHWIGILVFLNYVPYSKHFHIIMAFPNTYYSNLEPKGKVENMTSVTTEVKLMLNPNAVPPENYESPLGFGAKDVTDLTWKNLMDAYSCTECGRCTSVCPANITGKLLSPRKIMMDTRDRLEELGNAKDKNGKYFYDDKSLHDRTSAEELWACTTCNACAEACPINISPVDIIMQMRQYQVMELSAAPSELNGMLTNLENNGAPWKFSPSDRGNWSN
ncbi:MAG: (Fe-S)-binding protein [Bacteroidetes bacterium]|nr:(Fe-S)-binding protein [Bacteroidota bacterium]